MARGLAIRAARWPATGSRMKITVLHINALVVVVVIASIALGLFWMLLKNDLPEARFMFVGSLLKDCILAIIGIGWYFAKQPADKEKD